MIPASGAIIFDSQSPNSSIISPLSAAPRLSYDNAGGLNITSYTTGVSTFDRFTVDGSYGRLFGVSDSVTGVVFSVNDAAGLPIVEVESNFTDKITMGTYGTNALVVNDNKIGIGNPAPTAKLDIAETWNSNITVTGASGTGSIATITFAEQSAAIVVGSSIVVASINPSGYNGTFVVTASTTTSVSYANATTAAWVSGGTIQQLFTAVKLNVTDTASNAGSKLFDLQVGGVSRLSVRKDGYIYGNGGYNAAVFNAIQVANLFFVNPYTGNIGLSASTRLMWGNSNAPTNNDGDLMLYRDASAILAQRNVGTAQTFRVYNATDLSDGNPVNFDRATFGWTSNVLKIGTEMGGSYTTARYLELLVGGVTKVTISPAWVTFGDAVFADKTITIKGSGTSTAKAITVSNSGSVERFSVQDNGIINHTLGTTTYYAINQRTTNIVGWLGNGSNYLMNFDTLNGRVSFGDIIDPTERVEVSGNVRASNIIISPAASVTPPNNGDLTFQATSNTSVTLKLKGTDGVVRSASLTLA